MQVQDPKTVGVSPKAIAAALAALAAPYIVALLAKAVGLEVEVDTITAIIGPPILGAIAAGAAALARVGLVHIDDRPNVTAIGASGQDQGASAAPRSAGSGRIGRPGEGPLPPIEP